MKIWGIGDNFLICFELPDIGTIDPLFLFITEWQRPEGPSESYLVHFVAQRKVSLSQVLNISKDKKHHSLSELPIPEFEYRHTKKKYFFNFLKTGVLFRLDYCKLISVFIQNGLVAEQQHPSVDLRGGNASDSTHLHPAPWVMTPHPRSRVCL